MTGDSPSVQRIRVALRSALDAAGFPPGVTAQLDRARAGKRAELAEEYATTREAVEGVAAWAVEALTEGAVALGLPPETIARLTVAVAAQVIEPEPPEAA